MNEMLVDALCHKDLLPSCVRYSLPGPMSVPTANQNLAGPAVFMQDLESHLFGNPHSQHGWSGNEGSATAVAVARRLTLQMCNAPVGDYECVFTSGATGVECMYTQDSCCNCNS